MWKLQEELERIEQEKNEVECRERAKPLLKNDVNGFELRIGAHGELLFLSAEKRVEVSIKSCFPWSLRERLFSIRDSRGNELALIEDLGVLSPESRQAFEQSHLESQFLLKVEEVLDVREDYELRLWTVSCGGEVRSFQTRLDQWPRSGADGKLFIEDIAGDLYCVEEIKKLNASSRRLLWAYAG